MRPKPMLAAVLLALLLWTGATAAPVSAADGPISRKSYMTPENIPVDVYTAGEAATQPTAVVLAHGYGAAQAVMAGLAEAIARKGMTAVTFDFTGHGSNPNPLDEADPQSQFDADLQHVIAFTRTLPNVHAIALLGHSVGANTVVPYALNHADIVATIALSGDFTDVTPSSPRNLLLLVGGSELQLVIDDYTLARQNAGAEAARPFDFLAGHARSGVIIPDADHTGILFSPTTSSAPPNSPDGSATTATRRGRAPRKPSSSSARSPAPTCAKL